MEVATTRQVLYGLWQNTNGDTYVTTELMTFPVLRATARRLYYARSYDPDGTIRETGFIDRAVLERDGEVRRRSAGWWEPDAILYRDPPPLPGAAPAPADLGALKAAMAAAHPDRGGTDAAFVTARTAYEQALTRRQES
ncbi:hypothetical protein ABZ726_01585 [Streptomyces hundungensis]|uniref:hypothetical protein n=1 Tax=Streptomyces hundungensis TaxID=1077946 RepID=UPI0033F3F3D0